ncbi:MAG: thioredoxin family protein [Planctomycetota bacterium]|nr:thioredoxin family protein [Planctomycetota bacterium]MDA1249821.1 thioredoxin family protein [Planctomycetota bacterium]
MKSRIVFSVALVSGLLLAASHSSSAAKFNRVLDIGSQAPEWKGLEGVDGKKHGLAELKKAKAVVVVFTCNHCPVAKSYEKRLIELTKKYEEKGVKVVAISVSLYEADLLDEMKKRAEEKKYNFEYLHDPSQKIGEAFGVLRTPTVFLLDQDRKVAYMGAFDDDMYEERVTESYLKDGLDAVLSGKAPEVTETKSSGCPVAYE